MDPMMGGGAMGDDGNIKHTINSEMRHVLAEMAENSRRQEDAAYNNNNAAEGGGGGGGGIQRGSSAIQTGTRPSNESTLLKERISTLEDVLAKSEADRCAVYAKHEAAVRALNQANEDKTAMMHEFHDNTMSQDALNSARQEIEGVRAQTRQMSEHYEQQIAVLNDEVHKKDMLINKLKKAAKQREDKVDGVSLADLQFSNERLSAQLAKLTTAAAPQATEQEDSKVAACENAVSTLNSEVLALEMRLKQQVAAQATERQTLIERNEIQRREYDYERVECDRVFGIVNAKLEALVSENNFLRSQMTQLQQTMKQQQQQAQPSPTPQNSQRTSRRLYH